MDAVLFAHAKNLRRPLHFNARKHEKAQFVISEHILAPLFIVYGLRALKCSTSRMFAGKRLIIAYLMQH